MQWIDVSERQDNSLGVLGLVLKCPSRIRSFGLLAPASSWEFLCSRLFRQRVPNLAFVNL